MKRVFLSREPNPYLDLARGLAALLVMLGHLRAFIFVEFSRAGDVSFLTSAFYFVTSLGHQAVMVFFVMSGFLVGGGILRGIVERQWSWTDYAIKRMTRLWIVLVPALLLTSLWDQLGIALTHSLFYNGSLYSRYNSGPAAAVGDGALTFFGNLAFLQTIATPTFGSNGPLWSLANEFWYYLLFPMFVFAVGWTESVVIRLTTFVGALVISLFLPSSILIYGLIWLLGVVAFVMAQCISLSIGARKMAAITAFLLFGSALISVRVFHLDGIKGDVIVGVTFAGVVWGVTRAPSIGTRFNRVSHVMADFSYSLYLVHFPLAAFGACYMLENERFIPEATSYLMYVAFVVVTVLYAYGVYFCFERNTEKLQKYLLRRKSLAGLRPVQNADLNI